MRAAPMGKRDRAPPAGQGSQVRALREGDPQVSLPRCEGWATISRCQQGGRWEHDGHFYCSLHRPDRVAFGKETAKLREELWEVRRRMAKAVHASDDALLVSLARRWREIAAELEQRAIERRRRYGSKSAKMPVPLQWV